MGLTERSTTWSYRTFAATSRSSGMNSFYKKVHKGCTGLPGTPRNRTDPSGLAGTEVQVRTHSTDRVDCKPPGSDP